MRTQSGNFFRNQHQHTKVSRWYVFANRTEAVFYRDLPEHRFLFINRIKNPKGHLLEGEMDSDRPGTGMSSAGGGTIRHGLDRTFMHHEQNAERFAGVIARALTSAERALAFNELVIIAEPHFLGLLRAALPEEVKQYIKHEVNRELVQGSDEELRSAAIRAIELREQ